MSNRAITSCRAHVVLPWVAKNGNVVERRVACTLDQGHEGVIAHSGLMPDGSPVYWPAPRKPSEAST